MAVAARKAFFGDVQALSALSAAKAVWWAANGALARRITRPTSGQAAESFTPKAAPPDRAFLRKAWFEAFAKDARDVAAGLYPLGEALPTNLAEPLRRSLDFLIDARRVDARRRHKRGTEVRDEAASKAYPVYYRQNFHYQSGGWFTAESARRYEAQVEALFSGTAGPMRRRALSLLAKAWRGHDQRALRLLDVACGSGAFLCDLKAAFPRAGVYGLDLSAAYLEEAGRRSGAPRVQSNVERLPFAEETFDGLTCVYLFHELPPRLRPVVAGELARVLKSGGVLAFADSVQAQDAPQIARLLEAFPVFFHEPYYETYQETNLTALFAAAGLERIDEDQAFLTKAILFRKP